MQIADMTDAANPLLGVVDSLPDGTVFVKGNLTLISLNLSGMIFVINTEQGTYDAEMFFFLSIMILQVFSVDFLQIFKVGFSIDRENSQ